MYIDEAALERACAQFFESAPFNHAVIDGFFTAETAEALAGEFPAPESEVWYSYNNAIEVKKTCNNWNLFPPATYRVFDYLNSLEFLEKLGGLLRLPELSADAGLNGGGWHLHERGGKLNAHLDYNIHPKLLLQRKLNIIVYMNREWRPEWGGQLGLWAQSDEKRGPGALVETIDPVFNRAILFDTTQNSWHGLAAPVSCPEGMTRNSLAVYYLTPPPAVTEQRGKALFAPTAEQEGDQEVLELIAKRAHTASAASVYRAAREE